ncbi:MAG: TerC family protein [Gemmatimonadetes bacterium]|nr:TerC family protein [Gemmatimonadota bacterium]
MSLLAWIGFHVVVLALVTLDLRLHRGRAVVSMRSAAAWSAVWVTVALAFWLGLRHWMGPEIGLQFLSGYVIEKALSVDNLFVFAVVFSKLGIPRAAQHRVLFWGIIGALVLRGILIGTGTWLVARFDWILYIFGVFLILTGLRMFRPRGAPLEGQQRALQLARKVFPITDSDHGNRFFIGQAATPLFLALIMVETTDVIFALDSVPAVFAVTTDPFIVYTSNILAILGLRSLYFLLEGGMQRLRYLEAGLAVLLVTIGLKMVLADVLHPSPLESLLVIATILGTAVIASLVNAWRTTRTGTGAPVSSLSALQGLDKDWISSAAAFRGLAQAWGKWPAASP